MVDSIKEYKMFIDGAWQEAVSGERFESQQPWTEAVWATFPRADAEDTDKAVQAAHRAMTDGPWSKMTATGRGALMRNLGDEVIAATESLAVADVNDNGKLIAEMRGQNTYLAQFFYYFGGLADKIEGAVPPLGIPGIHPFTMNIPVGVVAAISPWNTPMLLTAAKIAPALAAGCAVVIKPSEHSSASALEFARLVEKSGFPPGVINVVTGFGQEAGDALVRHPLVKKIGFTGGSDVGRKINQAAASSFKDVSLELGGKSANIVFDDANLDDAVNGVVAGIFGASGQSCIAGSRLLLHEAIHDEFIDRLLKIVETIKVGSPFDDDTQFGPMTTKAQYEKVLTYIDIAKSEGATCIAGGHALDGKGWFVAPTIFKNVTNDMRIAREEVFGPVLSIIKFSTEEEAVAIANDTNYGLAGAVWSQDLRRCFEVSAKIHAGTVWVNTYRLVNLMMPFGGFKDSGKGRENGLQVIQNYLTTKSVLVNYGAPVNNPFVMKL